MMLLVCQDALSFLTTLPDEHVDCIVTSPPYFRLRNYDALARVLRVKRVAGEKEIGQEKTIQEYIDNLKVIFHETKRVLKSTGSLWVNIGDSYSYKGSDPDSDLPPKTLCLIPQRLAIALQKDGWIIRNDIIWAKKSPMPSSVRDRCTNAYEHILFCVKSKKYFYNQDAIREERKTHENRPDGVVRAKNYKSKFNEVHNSPTRFTRKSATSLNRRNDPPVLTKRKYEVHQDKGLGMRTYRSLEELSRTILVATCFTRRVLQK